MVIIALLTRQYVDGLTTNVVCYGSQEFSLLIKSQWNHYKEVIILYCLKASP